MRDNDDHLLRDRSDEIPRERYMTEVWTSYRSVVLSSWQQPLSSHDRTTTHISAAEFMSQLEARLQ